MSAPLALALDLAPDLALRNRLVPENEPGARGRQQHPRAKRVDDPVVPHVTDPGTLAEPIGRPAARVVVLRGGPDDHQENHADSGHDGAAPEAAFALDLLGRLPAGGPPAGSRCVRIAVRVRVMEGVVSHLRPSFALARARLWESSHRSLTPRSVPWRRPEQGHGSPAARRRARAGER